MYHVWAHVKQLNLKRPSNGALYNIVYGISDVERSVADKAMLHCVECLAEFTTTHKLYKHQFYVHRFGNFYSSDQFISCHICEKQVDLINAGKHAEKHSEFEMVS